MVKQFLKKRSKRVSTRKRTKIERKIREHNRKLKKDGKTNTHRKKKDPGVPNNYPFKEQVLMEAEERKQKLEEEKQKKKEQKKENAKAKKKSLESLVQDATKRTEDFNRKRKFVEDQSKDFTGGKNVENSLKAYYKEFKKVVNAADVILQVLDARDPIGSRCPQVEETVMSAGSSKKLVLLLNKIDLVPKENVEKWLKYLRNEFPTIAFKASTQLQRDNLSQSKVSLVNASDDLLKSSRCLGADMLMKLLGNYCRSQDIKTTIRVGVVGFPNTGKSSVINSLKRSKACNVGAMPGITRSMQEVHLDKHIKLLDSPGIVMAQSDSGSNAVLRNCVKLESLEDPVPAVTLILKRCTKQQVMLQYSIGEFGDVNEFLALLAKRMGRLKKGGIPDTNKAAKTVLQDWNTGRITYYTHPPEEHTLSSHLSAEIVAEMGKAFDIDALLSVEQKTLDELKQPNMMDIVVESEGFTEGAITESMSDVKDMDGDESNETDEEEMLEDSPSTSKHELAHVTVSAVSSRSRSRKSSQSEVPSKKTKRSVEDSSTVMSGGEARQAGNQQLNKEKKRQMKAAKKKRKRADAIGSKLSDALSGAFEGLGNSADSKDEEYDFSVM